MRSRACLALLSLIAASACANAPGDSTQATATATAVPLTGSSPETTARQAGCPPGAKCLPVTDAGGPSPTGPFVGQCTGRFPDYVDLVPASHTGRRFVLSQDFPASVPAASQNGPWLKIDFKTQGGSVKYMMALRDYIYEGMLKADWRAEDNTVRKWYHVPWMTAGRRPREFMRGMTEERPLTGPELGLKPKQTVQNWAIGYYNDVGAVSLNKVWADPQNPDPAGAQSAVGTVVVKVLFSAAVADDFSGADILAGAPAWDANIVASRKPFEKKIGSVRLLQMDVATKDPRSADTGWVFGTFAFDRDAAGSNGWEKMVPVGLMWGSDPTLLPSTGKPPVESLINPAAPLYARNHLGWAGRMNGPVDNPVSSCLGCHSTAQVPNVLSSMLPMRGCSDGQKLQWFRNLRGNVPFGAVAEKTCAPEGPPGVVALDYSLQLSLALNAVAGGQFTNPCAPAGPGRGPSARLGRGLQTYDVIR